MMDDRYHAVLRAALKARDDRTQWMALWQELKDIFLPQSKDFITEHVDGSELTDGLYETGPQLAARGLMSGIAATLRPPGKMWFKAKAKTSELNGLDHVRLWLYHVTQITYDAIYDPRVNADKVLAEVDGALVVLGTGIASVGWNNAADHLTLKAHSLADTLLFAGRDGNPNATCAFSQPTLRQIVEEFGEDKLTTKMAEAYAKPEPNLDQRFEMLHACIPNADWKQYGGKSRFAYQSLWISVGCKELIDESGYYEFPYIAPRWETMTGEVYGRSPAMIALPDARVVQAMSKDFLEAGQMALRPPTWSYAQMVQGALEMFPGGHTTIDMAGFQATGDPIKAIQIGAFPEKIFEVYERKNETIANAFFRDVMELPSARDADMTATEINARLDQYLRQAAPVYSRLEANYPAKLVNLVFGQLMRQKKYPPAPEEMWEQEIEFEYESPLKTAREKAEALKVIEGVQMLLPIAEAQAKLTGAADMLDNLDFDALARFTGQKADLPPHIFTPIDAMMQMREDRAKQKQQMMQAEMASKLAPAASQGVKALADAQSSGLMGSPAQLPAPALIPGYDDSEDQIMDAVYDEVA